MNGIDKITQRITEEIDREIADIQAAAETQAAAITADYAARAEKEAADLTARGQAAAAEREERLVSMAQMEAKKALLGVRQEMLGRAFDLAVEKLCALPEKEYISLLVDLIIKAQPVGTEAVIFSQSDRAQVGKTVVMAANERLGDGKLTLSEQTRPIRGGLILSDGSMEVNCSFEALVRLQKNEAAGEVAGVLFR